VSRHDETQIFIETPYRNASLFEDIIKTCRKTTRLCIAIDISLDSEEIRTRPIGSWKTNKPGLHKRQVVFLLGT
jgi:16S rRNA (cytidine1402-2'-O)-methyltransferase